MPKGYASLTAAHVRRGDTMRPVQIIGPEGEFMRVLMPVEAPADPYRCPRCGAVDKSPEAA